MEGVFLGGSVAAAFLAGTIALFAPCCITVLFPSYLAAAVRNARWRLVPLTLIFAAGVATVLVPVTLGVGLLTRSLLFFRCGATGSQQKDSHCEKPTHQCLPKSFSTSSMLSLTHVGRP